VVEVSNNKIEKFVKKNKKGGEVKMAKGKYG
jgi:hypothetical protein